MVLVAKVLTYWVVSHIKIVYKILQKCAAYPFCFEESNQNSCACKLVSMLDQRDKLLTTKNTSIHFAM